jgi:hypothetical protein
VLVRKKFAAWMVTTGLTTTANLGMIVLLDAKSRFKRDLPLSPSTPGVTAQYPSA